MNTKFDILSASDKPALIALVEAFLIANPTFEPIGGMISGPGLSGYLQSVGIVPPATVIIGNLDTLNVEMKGVEDRLDVLNAQVSLASKQDTGNASLSTIAAKDFSTSAKQDSLFNLQYQPKGNEVSGDSGDITTTGATDVLAAAGANTFNYITTILVTNGHATVGTFVKIQTEDGTKIWRGYAASAGGGYANSFTTPLKQPVSNKKIQAICETTGSQVTVSIAGFKGL